MLQIVSPEKLNKIETNGFHYWVTWVFVHNFPLWKGKFIGSKHVKKIHKFDIFSIFFFIFQFIKFLKKLSTKILYFITGDYAQRPKEFISENRLFLSCLVFEVKLFF